MGTVRNPDEGAKPFSIRPGIGGLPPLGGMFRAGDAATVPPHKHHLLVNMRINPNGMISRPGLQLVYDTGRSECIDGMIEQPETPGQMALLWPGFQTNGFAGIGVLNAGTFRAIFPRESLTYSEYFFVLEAAPAKDKATVSPVMGIDDPQDPTVLTAPFFLQGELSIFRRGEHDRLALYTLPLAPRSKLQAADCSRASDPDGPPGQSPPIVCPQGTGAKSGTQLWPYGHPTSAVVKKWELDPAFASWTLVSLDPWSEPGRGIITVPERIDNPFDGTPGVAEVLYWLMNDGVNDQILRWDGVQITVVHQVTFTGGTIGAGAYGPWVVSLADKAAGGTMDYLGADGAWHTCHPFSDFIDVDSHWNPTVWKGYPDGRILITWGNSVVSNWNGSVELDAFSYATEKFSMSEQLYLHEVPGDVDWADGVEHPTGSKAIIQQGSTRSIAYGGGESLYTISVGRVWIQDVGGDVLVGGYFDDNWDPLTGVAGPGSTHPHHAVYNVTDIAAVELVYDVADTIQPEDSGFHDVGGRYSFGCLPGVPGGADTGEGFGADYGGLG